VAATAMPGVKVEFAYSTVTHFNFIHFSCHRDAAKADKALKQPKEEWDGATVRNQQTKCNNLCPVWGPNITDEAYAQSVERYFQGQSRIARVRSLHSPLCSLLFS
jgi:E3 ubiquitin-protein ligase UBR4